MSYRPFDIAFFLLSSRDFENFSANKTVRQKKNQFNPFFFKRNIKTDERRVRWNIFWHYAICFKKVKQYITLSNISFIKQIFHKTCQNESIWDKHNEDDFRCFFPYKQKHESNKFTFQYKFSKFTLEQDITYSRYIIKNILNGL